MLKHRLWALCHARQHKLNLALFEAVSSGNMIRTQNLLDWGADANGSNGWDSILGGAARSPKSNADIMRLLLKSGAEINPALPLLNPLLHASTGNDEERIRILVEAGANLNIFDHYVGFNTPLQNMIIWADLAFIEWLISKGADPNMRGGRGQTPMHFAAVAGRVDVLELLLSHGVETNALDNEDETPIDWIQQTVAGSRNMPDEKINAWEQAIEFLRTH